MLAYSEPLGLIPSCAIPCHWYSVRVRGHSQGEKEVLGAQGEIASLGWLFTLKALRETKCHAENTKVLDFISLGCKIGLPPPLLMNKSVMLRSTSHGFFTLTKKSLNVPL